MAMASRLIPDEHRTTGLALLLTGVGTAKFVSSLMFGWLWQHGGIDFALQVFVVACVAVIVISQYVLRRFQHV